MKAPIEEHSDNVNSHALSLVERLSLFLEVQIVLIENGIFRYDELYTVERLIIQYPFLRGSTIRGFTVQVCAFPCRFRWPFWHDAEPCLHEYGKLAIYFTHTAC